MTINIPPDQNLILKNYISNPGLQSSISPTKFLRYLIFLTLVLLLALPFADKWKSSLRSNQSQDSNWITRIKYDLRPQPRKKLKTFFHHFRLRINNHFHGSRIGQRCSLKISGNIHSSIFPVHQRLYLLFFFLILRLCFLFWKKIPHIRIEEFSLKRGVWNFWNNYDWVQMICQLIKISVFVLSVKIEKQSRYMPL